jgi:DNA excision repair protein ERCC-5
VDGVVTEDNDTFLFGARHVYKNLFDASRNLEAYQMADVEAELSVDRQKLARARVINARTSWLGHAGPPGEGCRGGRGAGWTE